MMGAIAGTIHRISLHLVRLRATIEEEEVICVGAIAKRGTFRAKIASRDRTFIVLVKNLGFSQPEGIV